MKTTIATAVALAACVGTQVFAQQKEDTITFSVTGQRQVSVSTSPTVNNAGDWSEGPRYYKTGTAKMTDKDVIRFIGFVLHGNAAYYSSQAKLVLVQGELSGFFNITPDLGLSTANFDIAGDLDGSFASDDSDPSTQINNSTDSTYVQLDNGRHLFVNPIDDTLYPIGHLQPWGQIYIKDTGRAGFSVSEPLCENVTYFFAMTVEECYDCFYMNSFVSDSQFTIKDAQQSGPPCCGVGSTLTGKGKDRYYLSLSFDNTENNPYLYPGSFCYVGVTGIVGPIAGDAIVPDRIGYHDPIASLVASNLPYEARFTFQGILTYTWNLQFINKSDILPDFVGTGAYAFNGYGFISLFCELLTGTGSFTEKIVNTACCTGEDWFDVEGWYGVGAEYEQNTDLPAGYATLYEDGVYSTPLNVSTSLSFHQNFDRSDYPWNGSGSPSGWYTTYPYPENGVVSPLFWGYVNPL